MANLVCDGLMIFRFNSGNRKCESLISYCEHAKAQHVMVGYNGISAKAKPAGRVS